MIYGEKERSVDCQSRSVIFISVYCWLHVSAFVKSCDRAIEIQKQ